MSQALAASEKIDLISIVISNINFKKDWTRYEIWLHVVSARVLFWKENQGENPPCKFYTQNS